MQHWPIASATVVAGRLMTDDYGRGFMARARITWVDTAKGIAIVLVALAHSVQWTTTAGLAPDAWNDINLLLITFRMPLFFLASGLFAGSVLSRTWPELWRSRLSLLVWTFLLWSVVRFVFFLVVPNPGGTDESDPVALLLQPVMPHNGLWFLYALTIFFVLAKLARGRVDWRVQIGLATAIAVVWYAVRSTTSEGTGNIAWDGMARYLMFFLLGLHLRSAVIAFVERRGIVSGLGFGVLFLVLAGGILAVRGRFPLLTVGLVVVSVLAVLAGLIVARFPRIGAAPAESRSSAATRCRCTWCTCCSCRSPRALCCSSRVSAGSMQSPLPCRSWSARSASRPPWATGASPATSRARLRLPRSALVRRHHLPPRRALIRAVVNGFPR